MICHECAREGNEQAALAECRFCHVGLCKPHVVASYNSGVFPQYACLHHPERPFADTPARAERHLVAVGQ